MAAHTELAPLFSALVGDVYDSQIVLRKEKWPFLPRSHVRAASAMLEGMTFGFKQHILEIAASEELELSDAERAVLTERDLLAQGQWRYGSPLCEAQA